MRNIMLSIVLASSALAAGCSTPVEATCNKADECGELGDQTVEECIADLNESLDKLRAANKEACDKIADAAEAMVECMSGLSCAELKKDNISDTECKQASEDSRAAYIANTQACGVK